MSPGETLGDTLLAMWVLQLLDASTPSGNGVIHAEHRATEEQLRRIFDVTQNRYVRDGVVYTVESRSFVDRGGRPTFGVRATPGEPTPPTQDDMDEAEEEAEAALNAHPAPPVNFNPERQFGLTVVNAMLNRVAAKKFDMKDPQAFMVQVVEVAMGAFREGVWAERMRQRAEDEGAGAPGAESPGES